MAGRLLVKRVGKDFREGDTWERLIVQWFKALNRYLDYERGNDIPHWNDERSHTGFFAAAAWMLDGVALEEYAVERHGNGRGRRKGKGRCDLYFDVDNLPCLVEAKIEWRVGKKHIEDRLAEADGQLGGLPRQERDGCVSVALCWVVPELKQGSKGGEKVLTRIAKKFQGANHLVAIYSVPLNDRKGCEEQWRQTYPGIVLVGRLFEDLMKTE